MRVPISYALTYPERAATQIEPLDLAAGLILEFRAPDLDAFPCLALARAAGEAGDTAPCVLNAANEVAVGGLPRRRPAVPRHRRGRRADARPDRLRARGADLAELTAMDAEARRVASALTRELVH